MYNTHENICNLELEIKLDLNWFNAYGITNENTQKRLKVFFENLQQYTDLNPHHNFCDQLKTIFPENASLSDETRKSIDSLRSHEVHQNYLLFKKHLKNIENINKDRIEFTAYLNFLNHAYGIRDAKNNSNLESEQIEHFEALSLSALTILVLSYQLVNILYKYYSHPKDSYERQNIWDEYKYQSINTAVWLGVNISTFIINVLEASSHYTMLPVIGFTIECALNYQNFIENINKNEYEQKLLLEQYKNLLIKEQLQNNNLIQFFEWWNQIKHEERITQLKDMYLNTNDIEQQRILLTLLLNEQKNHLQETKLFSNFLMSSINLIAFISIQETIIASIINLHISLQISLILAISLLYACNVLKAIVVNQIAPKLTEKPLELKEDLYLIHGEIHDRPNESSWNETLLQISYDIAVKFSIPAIACILLLETSLSFEIILAIFIGLIIGYMAISKIYQQLHDHTQQPTEEIIEAAPHAI